MSAAMNPESLASTPLVVIIATESVTVLLLGFSGSLLDNHASRVERREADRIRQLANSTFEAILIHRDGFVLDGNERAVELLGLDMADLRGSKLLDCVVAAETQSPLTDLISPADNTALEATIIGAGKISFPIEAQTRTIFYGTAPAHVLAIRDIRERRAAEEQIRFLAHHDMLTRLPNRVMLQQKLDQSLERARADDKVTVLCLDLDGFKNVNDTLGHQAGDDLLQQVAERLRNNVRADDFVARVGGDEFVILASAGTSPNTAATLARRLLEALAIPFSLKDQIAVIGGSIGIASNTHTATDAMTLLKNGDIALYRSKEEGRGRYTLFKSGMDQRLIERRDMERALRESIANEQLALHFQPIFALDGRLVCMEALLRWPDRDKGFISPADFIPMAEDLGLIVPLGNWVLRKACKAASLWPIPCKVAVNFSPVQFQSNDLTGSVMQALHDTGLSPSRLEMELTEGVLIDNFSRALGIVTTLRESGVQIVLDDFGTGYSSMAYLHRFPFDKLKIDRSFMQRFEDDAISATIIDSIITLAHGLHLKVTAEGIEHRTQLDHLRTRGCDEMQGFLLGRPMPEDQIASFMREALLLPTA